MAGGLNKKGHKGKERGHAKEVSTTHTLPGKKKKRAEKAPKVQSKGC